MDDLISRQDVLDWLEKEWDGMVVSIFDGIKALPSAQQEPQWIPCSERLPDIDADGYTDKVLVSFDHYSGVEICEYRITDGVGRWYAGDTDDSPEDIDLQVTAWMPLPKRYEGGDT